MDLIQTIAIVIQTGAIVASAIGAVVALFWARRIARRRATLDLLLLEQTKPEWIEQRRAFNKLCREQGEDLAKWATKEKINNTDNDSNTALINAILNQYEWASIGIHKGIIDEDSYRASCRTTLVKDWRTCKPFVTQLRQTTDNPAVYTEFEKLAKRWADTDEEKRHIM